MKAVTLSCRLLASKKLMPLAISIKTQFQFTPPNHSQVVAYTNPLRLDLRLLVDYKRLVAAIP